MKRKIICTVLAVLTMSLAVVGCGRNEITQSSGEVSQVSSGINSNSQENSSVMNNDYIVATPSGFSDGYAWIQVNSNSGGITNNIFIDKQGNVYDELYKCNIYGTWHDGTVSGEKLIANSKGDIIFQADEEYTNVLTYGGGYYAIAKHVHSLESDKYLIYFLDTDGQWFDTNYDLNLDYVTSENVTYLGEQIFQIGNVFINLKTKEAIEVDFPGGIVGEFSNGVAVCKKGYDKYNALVYTDGTIKEIKIENINIEGKVSDGGFVYSYHDYNDEVTHLYFYDISSGKSNEITSYKDEISIRNKGNLYFENGSLFLNLCGVDNNYYITFFDKSGKELMEAKSYYTIGERACDRVVTISKDETITIYDAHGNIVFETDEYKIGYGAVDYSYSDDCIPVYVKKYEENNFLDKDGNLLFPQGLLSDNLHKIQF